MGAERPAARCLRGTRPEGWRRSSTTLVSRRRDRRHPRVHQARPDDPHLGARDPQLPEILNYFTYRLTNAFAEGTTNRIKVVKRQAYGMRNFDNFRDRVLVQCGVPKPRRNPG